MKKIKVLHCPLNNGNHRWLLSRAERRLGVASDLVIFKSNPFYNNYDKNLQIDFPTLFNEIKRINFFRQAIKNYDIFHFNFGQSILDHPFPGFNLLDLPLLKKLDKKVVMTYQGDDVRIKKYYLDQYGYGPYNNTRYSLGDRFWDYERSLRVKKVSRYADKIFAISPDLLHFLPEKAELFLTLVDIDNLKFRPPQKKKRLTIVHAPSDRSAKGTEFIINAVKEISRQYPINFVLIEKMPQKQALALYRQADLCLDQVLVGWYGTFAVEMMALGVPVIAYLRQEDLEKFVPFKDEIPVVNTDKDHLKETVIMLLKNFSLRRKLAYQGRAYVEKYHHPLKAAQRTKKVYQQLCGLD